MCLLQQLERFVGASIRDGRYSKFIRIIALVCQERNDAKANVLCTSRVAVGGPYGQCRRQNGPLGGLHEYGLTILSLRRPGTGIGSSRIRAGSGSVHQVSSLVAIRHGSILSVQHQPKHGSHNLLQCHWHTDPESGRCSNTGSLDGFCHSERDRYTNGRSPTVHH